MPRRSDQVLRGLDVSLRIIDVLLLVAHDLADALAAQRRAQAEGRELTDAELDQLDRVVTLRSEQIQALAAARLEARRAAGDGAPTG